MNPPMDRGSSMVALQRALPYLRLFKNGVFVVKIGGAVCGEPGALRDLSEQLGVLSEVGIRVVLVHGGGPQTTALAERLGEVTEMVDGRRVTTEAGLEVAVMTLNGSVRTAILSAARATGLSAVGISGADAGLVRAHRRPPVRRGDRTVDFGLVGDVDAVDPGVVLRLLDAGYVPVVSPLCADDEGRILNVNADTVASHLARALGADKLILMTDAPGLLEDRSDPRTLVSYTDLAGLDEMESRGCFDAGMLPKVTAAREAVVGGVARVHLVGWRVRAGLLHEVFTNEGAGTLIVKNQAELLPAEALGAAG